jgi:hypothetical protein
VTKKVDKEVWRGCTDFLPEDFEKVLASLRSDVTKGSKTKHDARIPKTRILKMVRQSNSVF